MADFREYYGLWLSEIGLSVSYDTAAALAVQLPQGSRVMMRIDPDTAYGIKEHYLRLIEYWVKTAVWQHTEDGANGANQPELVPLPSEAITVDKVTSAKSHVDAVLKARGLL